MREFQTSAGHSRTAALFHCTEDESYEHGFANWESSHESSLCRISLVLHWNLSPHFPCLSSQITRPVARMVSPFGRDSATSSVSANVNGTGVVTAIPLLLTFIVEHSMLVPELMIVSKTGISTTFLNLRLRSPNIRS